MKSRFDPYAVLEIHPQASSAQIKEAYKRLAYKHHPDKHSEDNKAVAETRFKEIVAAYEMLTKNNVNSPAYHPDLDLDIGDGAIVPFGEENNPELASEDSTKYITQAGELSEISENNRHPLKNIDKPFSDIIQPLESIPTDGFANEIKSLTRKMRQLTPHDKWELCEKLTPEEMKAYMDYQAQHYANIDENVKEKAFLWKAEKEGVAPVYIFGTVHDSTIDINDIFGDALTNILDKVDDVFTEVAINPYRGLKNDIPTGIDDFIAQKAEKMGKNSRFLENSESIEAAGRVRNPLTACQIPARKEILKDLEQFSNNFLTHISPEEEERTFSDPDNPDVKRNFFWMNPVLETSQAQKSCLVACGSAHNAGKYGLPNLLASEGYQLTPLMKVPPVPKSTLLREAFQGTCPLFFKTDQKDKKPGNEHQSNKIPGK